jgi:polar amino acid transport system substrate-binding protein
MKRFLFLSLLMLVATSAAAQKLRVITEEWPPFNHTENGHPSGLAVEMTQALLKDSGLSADIEFFPWNRAYAMGLKDPNTLIFTLGRNPEREARFNWLFKVSKREMWLFRLSERIDIKVENLESAKKYIVGSGTMEDVSTQELIKRGFVVGKNLDLVNGSDADKRNIAKLQAGRMDLLAANPLSLAYASKAMQMPFNRFAPVLRLSGDDAGYWVALSLNSDSALLQKLKDSAKRLDEGGAFKALQDKYLR